MNSKRRREDIFVCLDVYKVSSGSNGHADGCLLICEKLVANRFMIQKSYC